MLGALQRKEKGFLYLETHAGRGAYDLSQGGTEAEGGVSRFSATANNYEELQRYATRLEEYRARLGSRRAYPGSPLLAASELRPQDRAVLVELVPAEARALELAVADNSHLRVEQGDGFDRLRAWLPPVERRGLTFIDPPYEETSRDFERVTGAIVEALRRFSTGIIAAWYPVKEERDIATWQAGLARALDGPAHRCETLVAELWLYPRDSRVGLNGSGMLIVNPPYLLAERMRVWLPELQAQLDRAALPTGQAGGTSIRLLTPA
ncbi:MAG TPA: 23S rRNA (adenine(2030)-N(6))-methyltransferase RlmJ [Steroidobacteraceae bacterium]|nr:23S rRNA (adenine(2030)-N(6))-methyltransferase RlmJ [Steroidobacteraceae bacterium]